MREEALEAAVIQQYAQAALMWCMLRREFLYAAEKIEVTLGPVPLAAPAHCWPSEKQLVDSAVAAHHVSSAFVFRPDPVAAAILPRCTNMRIRLHACRLHLRWQAPADPCCQIA